MMSCRTQQCARSLVNRYFSDKPYTCLSYTQKTHPFTAQQHRHFSKVSICDRKFVSHQDCAHINNTYWNNQTRCLHTTNYNGSIKSYFASLATCSNNKTENLNEFFLDSTTNSSGSIDRSVLDPFAKGDVASTGAESSFLYPPT